MWYNLSHLSIFINVRNKRGNSKSFFGEIGFKNNTKANGFNQSQS